MSFRDGVRDKVTKSGDPKGESPKAKESAGHGLSAQDVARLAADRSGESRQATVQKLAATYAESEMSPAEREAVMALFQMFARDAEQRVRAALAASVKSLPDLPHDLAMILASDEAEVAGPILESASVLTEADLLMLVRDSDTAKLLSIAKREHVPGSVADALVDSGNEAVVATVVSNPGADLSDRAMERALAAFPNSETVKEGLVSRPVLPVTIAERLVNLVSERLRERLVTHHALSPDMATDLVLESRERATMSLLRGARSTLAVEALAKQLHKNGRLTESLILRAAVLGDIDFLESSLAVIAGIPRENARLLVHDAGRRGLASLLKKADFPVRLAVVLQTAVEVADETQFDGLERDRERYAVRMIERVLTAVDENPDNILDQADVDYLIRKIDRLQGPQAIAC